MKEQWEKRARHTEEVTSILKEFGAMDSKGLIRKWNPTIKKALNDEGHDSLDPDKCKCLL